MLRSFEHVQEIKGDAGPTLNAMAVKVRYSAISIGWCSEASRDSLKSKSCFNDS